MDSINLTHIYTNDELLDIGRKAIEDTLIKFRDNRLSTLGRNNNGLVIKERDGEPSNIIRLTIEDALRIGLKAIHNHLNNLYTRNRLDTMPVRQHAERADTELGGSEDHTAHDPSPDAIGGAYGVQWWTVFRCHKTNELYKVRCYDGVYKSKGPYLGGGDAWTWAWEEADSLPTMQHAPADQEPIGNTYLTLHNVDFRHNIYKGPEGHYKVFVP
jgi:hypothetical protein